MPETLRKIRIFISSPSDVRRERDALEKVITQDLQQTLGKKHNLYLEPLRWEKRARPGMGDIQSRISRQMGEYDIFIGIFWKRFGTPTARSKSGSEEEFREAYSLWEEDNSRPVMMYFCEREANISLNIDPDKAIEQIQHAQKVKAFREEIGQKGLYWTYKEVEDFVKEVRQHLHDTILELVEKSKQVKASIADVILPSESPQMGEENSQKQVLAIIHGIRTRATWAEEIGEVIQKEASNIVATEAIRWGHFGLIAFLLPFSHRLKPVNFVAAKIRNLVNRERENHPGETIEISVLAHSYGTYIISKILSLPETNDLKFCRVILCGSIIKEDHRWDIADARVKDRIVNDCGYRDIWPIMAKSMTVGYGPTGVVGITDHKVKNRYHPFKHSDFFNYDFAKKYWAPYYKDGTIVPRDSKRKSPPWILEMMMKLKVGMLVILAALVLGGWWGVDKYRGVDTMGPAFETVADWFSADKQPSNCGFDFVTSEYQIHLYSDRVPANYTQIEKDLRDRFFQCGFEVVQNEEPYSDYPIIHGANPDMITVGYSVKADGQVIGNSVFSEIEQLGLSYEIETDIFPHPNVDSNHVSIYMRPPIPEDNSTAVLSEVQDSCTTAFELITGGKRATNNDGFASAQGSPVGVKIVKSDWDNSDVDLVPILIDWSFIETEGKKARLFTVREQDSLVSPVLKGIQYLFVLKEIDRDEDLIRYDIRSRTCP